MYTKHTSSLVYRRYTLALIGLLLLNLLVLPPVSEPKATAQGLNSYSRCLTDLSFDGTVFALSTNNRLLNFSPQMPGLINSLRSILGLPSGENPIAIDFRPATGELFGLSNASRLYSINPETGAATAVGAAFTPALTGAYAGLGFNPTVDRLRLVTETGQNLRLNPLTGTVAGTDTTLAFAAGDPNAGWQPNLVGAAYDNSLPNATTTTLYGIDGRGWLVRQGSVGGAPVSPNAGQLFTVGALGISLAGQTGFDIAPSGTAYLALTQPGSAPQLFAVNLETGAAALRGNVGLNEPLRAVAVGTQGTTTVPSSSFLRCLQDDKTGDHLQINTCTGDYQFTQCGGNRVRLNGRGIISRSQPFRLHLRDARVQAEVELRPFGSLNPASAVIHPTVFTRLVYHLEDSSIKDSSCSCH